MSYLTIVGALLTQVMTLPTICIGRLLSGVAAGTLNVVMSKALYETVP